MKHLLRIAIGVVAVALSPVWAPLLAAGAMFWTGGDLILKLFEAYWPCKRWDVAQPAEHPVDNRKVAGSKPAVPTT